MYRDFKELLYAAKRAPRRTIAIAAAAEKNTIRLVTELKRHNLCDVILVDNSDQIRAIAHEQGANLSGVTIIDERDPAKVAMTTVKCVNEGRADVFVKGGINTSDFLRAVLDKEVGLRTGRRLSSLTCYDVPSMEKLFFITDGGMNIAPDLMTKVEILRNAIEVLHKLGVGCPKVALLSANERVNPEMQSSVDAFEICCMAEKGELPDAIYEGPIAFDVAMRPDAAKAKGIDSKISGDVDLFLVPNIETGNCLGKAIGFFGHGQAAVLLVGASHPVVMTSRSASVQGKLVTVAFAILVCNEKQNNI